MKRLASLLSASGRIIIQSLFYIYIFVDTFNVDSSETLSGQAALNNYLKYAMVIVIVTLHS